MKDYIRNHKSLLLKIVVFAALAVVCALLTKSKFYTLILCLVGIYTISSSGLDVLFGYSGQISTGHAGFFAIGAYTSSLLSLRLGVPPILSMLCGAILAAGVAMLLAIPASKLKKHFLSVLTMAFGQIVMLLVTTWSFTGAASGLSGIPKFDIFGFVLKSRTANFIFIAILAIIALVLKRNLIHSRVGLALMAIRDNTVAAQGLGIDIRRYKSLAFAFSAFYTAIGGALYAHLVGYISPESFSSVQSILFLTILLFGGIGSLYGALIGAAVILPIQELFQSFVQYQGLIYAFFILIVLFFFPGGVVGLPATCKQLFQKLKKRGDLNAQA